MMPSVVFPRAGADHGRRAAPAPWRSIALLARKEGGELVASQHGLAWLAALAMALSAFSLLFVRGTELSLLENAEAVYMMQGVVAALAALLAVVVGNDSIAGERDRGSLVPLLVAPISRDALLFGKLGGIAVVWGVFLLLALPYLWAVGSTGQNLVAAIVSLTLLGTPMIIGLGLLAMGLGARLASSRGSLMASLLVLLVAGCPLVLGPSLRQSAVGRAFDAIDPFAAALNSFDAVVIDSQSLLTQPWNIGLLLVWLLGTAWFARRTVARLSD
jgi:ABC-type transport system involved in multi-copper enzyme maturation permease subunit